MCFYGPGEWWPVVLLEESIGDDRVLVFGIEEESVHVEETCSDWGEAGMMLARVLREKGQKEWEMRFQCKTYSVRGAIFVVLCYGADVNTVQSCGK